MQTHIIVCSVLETEPPSSGTTTFFNAFKSTGYHDKKTVEINGYMHGIIPNRR